MVTTPAPITSTAAGIGVAVGVYGISFGVLAVAAGMSPVQAAVMSMLVFTGASQFAFVGVLGAGGGALAAIGPGGDARRCGTPPTASRVAPILRGRLHKRALAAQLVIDETHRDGAGPERRAGRPPCVRRHRRVRLRSAGASARSPARCSAARSATRARSGSTRCSRPPSSRCSPRSSTVLARRLPRRRARPIALLVLPFAPRGSSRGRRARGPRSGGALVASGVRCVSWTVLLVPVRDLLRPQGDRAGVRGCPRARPAAPAHARAGRRCRCWRR